MKIGEKREISTVKNSVTKQSIPLKGYTLCHVTFYFLLRDWSHENVMACHVVIPYEYSGTFHRRQAQGQ